MTIPLLAMLFLMLAGWWTEIRNLVNPQRALVSVGSFVVLLAYEAHLHHMTALVVALMLSPMFVLLMRPSYKRVKTPTWSYMLSALYIVASLCIAALALPLRPLLLVWIALLATLWFLNAPFYLFLVEERRIVFMLAGVPMHVLHHFLNGFSFLFGVAHHGLRVRHESTLQSEETCVTPRASDCSVQAKSSLQ